MPRRSTRDDPGAVRSRRRYRVGLELGYDSRTAQEGAGNIGRFCELVRAKGRDPTEFGQLAVRLSGGKPRLGTPKSLRIAAAYRRLRDLGASSAEATVASKTAAATRALEALLLAVAAGEVESTEP
jgi:hypothetical protein